MANQRIFVLSAEGASDTHAPVFHARASVPDDQIDLMARNLFGTKPDGSPHDWAAFDLNDAGDYAYTVEREN